MKTFARFWYDFIVGDEWTIAVAVVVVLGGAALLAHAGLGAWWWMVAGVLATLGWSVWRGARATRRR